MLPYTTFNNIRLDFHVLQEHYEGIGINATNVLRAEDTINDLFYAGEKKPTMWKDEFEKILKHASTIVHKIEKRNLFAYKVKLRVLIREINADFLQNIMVTMSIGLTRNTIHHDIWATSHPLWSLIPIPIFSIFHIISLTVQHTTSNSRLSI